jgi:hypothetical protein
MHPWPTELQPVFEKFATAEYASLTKAGAPITFPGHMYVGATTLDTSTGLTYPAKAERARRNPQIAFLYSDPKGSSLIDPPTVLVLGQGAVRDRDLQANTDRYVTNAFRKYPASYSGMPKFLLRQAAWYFTRIWIELTPLEIIWWPKGDLSRDPDRWQADSEVTVPVSDPAPPGGELPAWKPAPTDWQAEAAGAIPRFGLPILTFVNEQGYPIPARTRSAQFNSPNFELTLPQGLTITDSKACLTFHRHPKIFTGQENRAFAGRVTGSGTQATFTVERQLANWSAGGESRLKGLIEFTWARNKIASRLQSECARRGQPVPRVNL